MGKPRQYRRDADLEKKAALLIAKFSELSHIDAREIAVFRELSCGPSSAIARIQVTPPQLFQTEMVKCRYIITFYQVWCDSLTVNQETLVLYHELMHVDPDNGLMRDHDIKEFRVILERYGVGRGLDREIDNILDLPGKTLSR